jgi:hypothetical protein
MLCCGVDIFPPPPIYIVLRRSTFGSAAWNGVDIAKICHSLGLRAKYLFCSGCEWPGFSRRAPSCGSPVMAQHPRISRETRKIHEKAEYTQVDIVNANKQNDGQANQHSHQTANSACIRPLFHDYTSKSFLKAFENSVECCPPRNLSGALRTGPGDQSCETTQHPAPDHGTSDESADKHVLK